MYVCVLYVIANIYIYNFNDGTKSSHFYAKTEFSLREIIVYCIYIHINKFDLIYIV